MKEYISQNNFVSTNREGDMVAYDVPVVHPKRKKQKYDNKTVSLKNHIQLSENVDEVNALLEKSSITYKKASNKTIKQWKKAANKRIQQLTQ